VVRDPGDAGVSAVAALRWSLDPGSPATRAGLVARLLVAAVLLQAGAGKFLGHAAYVERFDRWGFPAPGAVAILVGVTEIACGLAMLLGVATRPAGLVVVATMAGALLTAGRVDGGTNVWLPPLVALAAAVVVVRGAGPWALGRRLAGRPGDATAAPAGRARAGADPARDGPSAPAGRPG
jgi:putative oxidoreductase